MTLVFSRRQQAAIMRTKLIIEAQMPEPDSGALQKGWDLYLHLLQPFLRQQDAERMEKMEKAVADWAGMGPIEIVPATTRRDPWAGARARGSAYVRNMRRS